MKIIEKSFGFSEMLYVYLSGQTNKIKIMELIETTEHIAKSILDSKKRQIKANKKGILYWVIWINNNNHTSGLSSRRGHEFTANNEDLTFFIQVPKNSKTVY